MSIFGSLSLDVLFLIHICLVGITVNKDKSVINVSESAT